MWLLLAFLPLALASDSLRLLHRIYHPKVPGQAFSERGSLLLSRSGPVTHASLVPSETFPTDLLEFAQILHNAEPSSTLAASSPSDAGIFDDDALYQVALEHPGDTDQSQWDVSSVKACHLLLPSTHHAQESLILHVDGSAPFAIDYFVGPVPHDGACPKGPSRRIRQEADTPKSSLTDVRPIIITNTTVFVAPPRTPPLPLLRQPPPLTPEGKVVEPVPEKTFLQKYWMYILIAVMALILTPGAPEEEGGGNARQGGR